jgi:N-acetylglucosamine-6-phosphate deacetylase
MGLAGFGVIAEGNIADLVVLDRAFRVTRTIIGGETVYEHASSGAYRIG